MNRLRVVLDTNIYIFGLVFGGVPAEILALATERAFVLCVSDAIRDEVVETLRRKFRWTEQQILSGCEPLWEVASSVDTSSELAIITADPDDDRILECAVDGKAEILISGDNHILNLLKLPLHPAIQHIRILAPKAFLDELGS